MIDAPCSYDELLAKFSAACKERDELKKKQMPMKPRTHIAFLQHYKFCACNYEFHVPYGTINFCPICGQAIDWN